MADPELLFAHALADRLHKTITEIEALPYERFVEHRAYARLIAKEIEENANS